MTLRVGAPFQVTQALEKLGSAEIWRSLKIMNNDDDDDDDDDDLADQPRACQCTAIVFTCGMLHFTDIMSSKWC